MRVIVVGAGEVGLYVADLLSREGHDVVVIDNDPGRIHDIEKLDVSLVLGSATHPEIMSEAGIDRADMLVAVTSNDEVNLISCLLAKRAGVEQKIARIETPSLRAKTAQDLHEAVGADHVIDPDNAIANQILGLLTYPGVTEFVELGDGEAIMIACELSEDAPLAGQTLSEIAAKYEPDWDFIVATISRGDDTVIPRSDHRLEPGDRLQVISKRKARKQVLELLGLARRTHRRVMLLGGGRTAAILAQRLTQRHTGVTLIEGRIERAKELAERLEGVLVLHGDITDGELLQSEDVGSYDAVVALTGDDDANILACLFGKSAGTHETIAVLHRLELQGLLREVGIDVAISPRIASAEEVLRFVRGGITKVARSLTSDIEVLELEVAHGSEACGKTVSELGLPHDTLVGAIIRKGKAQIGRRWTELNRKDHVVVVARPHSVPEIRRLFAK